MKNRLILITVWQLSVFILVLLKKCVKTQSDDSCFVGLVEKSHYGNWADDSK